MSKLFKLKEWLTLDEAASHISSAIGEEVQIKDLYRLALDKYLTLSVNLVNYAQAKRGDVVGPEEVRLAGKPSPWFAEVLEKVALENGNDPKMAYEEIVLSLSIGDDLFLNLDEKVTSIGGVWDLPLWGNEHLDIQHRYQHEIGGPEVTLVCIEGTYVRKGDIAYELQDDFDDNEYQKGSKAQKADIERFIVRESLSSEDADKLRVKYKVWREEYLEERKSSPKESNYHPAAALPSDSVVVVRTEEILRFLSSIDENDQPEKPLGTRERNTLLALIATLCKEAKIDYEARGIASAIEKMTEIHGVKISDDKIRGILKLLPDAVESRQK